MGWLYLSLVGILVASVVFLRKAGGGKFPWIQFYTRGKEAGFSFREVNLLRKIAVNSRLKDPTSLFWSVKALDRSIRDIIIQTRSKGTENDPDQDAFIAKLFQFRKQVEFSQPKYRLGLKSTRNIVPRQRIKIVIPGVGVYQSMVVENLRKYIAVSYPQGKPLPEGYAWKGQEISVYFWRAEDAGYYFESKVIEDYYNRDYPILHISHSDNLIRNQKRRSVRVDVNLPARVYPLKNLQEATELPEKSPGLRARLINISEDGAALIIGGKGKVGISLKFQFPLSDHTIVMIGTVKQIRFDQKKNQSSLHLEAKPPSPNIRNRILTYVYDIFDEQKVISKTPTQRIASSNAGKKASGNQYSSGGKSTVSGQSGRAPGHKTKAKSDSAG
ncbi:MAG: PilZ domain-containing protein [Spirochaetales bacterium]|nr:PilZ domain-containing protein [Spirochaetales bacterium]MCF7937095.1 PilZ domain-containing protein [Spirochaetales bacterium]